MSKDVLEFGSTVVAKDNFKGAVHIRTNGDEVTGAAKYAVFDDITQVSPVYYRNKYENCVGFARGYSEAKYE